MGKHLILTGGGHAHLSLLLNAGDYTRRGHQVTLISPSPYQYYSGMGAGLLSGVYRPREVRFNIRKMAEQRDVRFIETRATRIRAGEQICLLANGQELHYDVVSFNVGSIVALESVAGAAERAIPVKPVENLARARRMILNEPGDGELKFAVVGGGAAGVEVAGNLRRLLQDQGRSGRITLIDSGRILHGFPFRARRLALESLAARSIECLEGSRALSVEGRAVALSDGRTIPYDYVFMAVGVSPAGLFRDSGLSTGNDGSLLVGENLQSVDYDNIFGGGDCIGMKDRFLAKVGVHAVRQSRILHHNLLAALDGGDMRRFDHARPYMLILNMGDNRGILWRNGLVLEGRLSYRIKDWIDRRFMKRFQVSGEREEALDSE
jgi:NADH dehydrogenase FAD-containing subunit